MKHLSFVTKDGHYQWVDVELTVSVLMFSDDNTFPYHCTYLSRITNYVFPVVAGLLFNFTYLSVLLIQNMNSCWHDLSNFIKLRARAIF